MPLPYPPVLDGRGSAAVPPIRPMGFSLLHGGFRLARTASRGLPTTWSWIPLMPNGACQRKKTREDDDDMQYLNAPIANGLYTPVTTYAPIKTRKQNREGVGLIAVTASFENGSAKLTDKVRLAVTVPDFITHIK